MRDDFVCPSCDAFTEIGESVICAKCEKAFCDACVYYHQEVHEQLCETCLESQ